MPCAALALPGCPALALKFSLAWPLPPLQPGAALLPLARSLVIAFSPCLFLACLAFSWSLSLSLAFSRVLSPSHSVSASLFLSRRLFSSLLDFRSRPCRSLMSRRQLLRSLPLSLWYSRERVVSFSFCLVSLARFLARAACRSHEQSRASW